MKAKNINQEAQLFPILTYYDVVQTLAELIIRFRLNKYKTQSSKKTGQSKKFREAVKFYIGPFLKQMFLHAFFILGAYQSVSFEKNERLLSFLKTILIIFDLCKFEEYKWLSAIQLNKMKHLFSLSPFGSELLGKLHENSQKNLTDFNFFSFSRRAYSNLKKSLSTSSYVRLYLFFFRIIQMLKRKIIFIFIFF